jgi:5-formaminoimidazole-4-carboxamide-1-beta-D-ribofuranosyl 5'-monophosphate synthetase
MNGGGSAQDVIVEFALPELVAGAVMKLVFGFLFEGIDEEEEVGIFGRSRREEVEMAGHCAIGVDGERVADGFGFESIEDGEGGLVLREERLAFVAAEGDEIISFAKVVVGGEADVFAEEGGHLNG